MTKKKLSRDQKRKQKRQKRGRCRKQAAYPRQYQNMLQRLEESGLGKHKIVYNSPGTAKMSEVLREFIEPYDEFADSTDAMHRLLATALVAWNTALMPEAERAESLKQVSKNLPADAVEDFYAIVEEMIARKERYFAQYNRYILEYELTETENDYHIAVISTEGPKEAGES